MPSNILQAIHNIVTFGTNDLGDYATKYRIRINNAGEPLEYYIKDAFANSLAVPGNDEKDHAHSTVFAYLGNQNNPPDAVLYGGDALEIKKIEGAKSILALNNSAPKSMLHRDDPRILGECRNCDGGNWRQKDLYYIVGYLTKKPVRINYLFFVHGQCYAADRTVYEGMAQRLKSGIDAFIELEGLESKATTELGRIPRVDPLGITSFRMRGMWEIQNPVGVFSYLHQWNPSVPFTIVSIMTEEKYQSYPANDRSSIERNPLIRADQRKIKNPNNPAILIPGRIIVHEQRTAFR